MPWRRALFRGQTVLARCDDVGAFVADGGRVEIRYRRDDGRAYHAGLRNLAPAPDATVHPDAYCGPGEAVARDAATARSGAGASGRAGASRRGSEGERVAPRSRPLDGEILVYADGACSGNPGPAGLGVVMLWDEQGKELAEYLGVGTNNIAELTGILRALEGAPDLARPMRIFTDSSYSIGVLSKGWKAKANVELVARIRARLAEHPDVRLHYVKGHAGIDLNERADALARAAVDARRSSGWQAITRRLK